MTRALAVLVLVLVVAACGRVDFDPRGDGGFSPPPPGDGSQSIGMGSGTISAPIAACLGPPTFSTLAAAYSTGHVTQPGDLDIFLIDHAIACDAGGVGLMAWDEQSTEVPDGTQVLGFKLGSVTPGTYNISIDDPPAAGEAIAIYWALQRPVGGGESSCISAPSGGTITVTVQGDGTVSGSFDVNMQGTTAWSAVGTFDAVYCGIGWYPAEND
ncbi:MAG TPA: hypothetical protein VGF94_17745 [Kofleriaceae bacterium]|jgi:hypothetical protein